MKNIQLFPRLKIYCELLNFDSISRERKIILQPLIDYVQSKSNSEGTTYLNFICTHNSRRSQFSQIWAQTAAGCYGIKAECYSGGVEVTAFNEKAAASIERAGFKVEKTGNENPEYSVYFSVEANKIRAFSKLFDNTENPSEEFAAVMTCSDADANCPFIPGAEKRISLPYNDPKEFDDTKNEAEEYDKRSQQIATELFYVFSKINKTYV